MRFEMQDMQMWPRTGERGLGVETRSMVVRSFKSDFHRLKGLQ